MGEVDLVKEIRKIDLALREISVLDYGPYSIRLSAGQLALLLEPIELASELVKASSIARAVLHTDDETVPEVSPDDKT